MSKPGRLRAGAGVSPAIMTQHQTLTPADDYETVRAAIAYLSETGAEDIDLARFSRSLGLTERQLTDLFRRWCGLSPKSFAPGRGAQPRQAPAGRQARACCRPLMRSGSARPRGCTICSSPMRRCRPAPIRQWRRRARDGVGRRALAVRHRRARHHRLGPRRHRLCRCDARYRGRLRGSAAPLAQCPLQPRRRPGRADRRARLRSRPLGSREQPVKLVLIGTDFEVSVWETLLKIPVGTRHDLPAGRPRTSAAPPRRAPSAPPSARTRSRSSCPATASSARPARSPATTGASRASARSSAGKRGWSA